MKQSVRYSDELLNAFIDGELDAPQRQRLLGALREDQELSARLCALQNVRSMVRFAYEDITPTAGRGAPAARLSPRVQALAASVLLAVGVSIGWGVQTYLSTPSSLVELARTVHLNPASSTPAPWRLMLHVTTGDGRRLQALLEETEQLLQNYGSDPLQVQVEILANGGGLQLLREEATPHAEKIRELQRRYANLTFLACSKAIKRLQEEQGIDVRLVPEAQTVPSAIQQIIQRQKEGWSYIQL